MSGVNITISPSSGRIFSLPIMMLNFVFSHDKYLYSHWMDNKRINLKVIEIKNIIAGVKRNCKIINLLHRNKSDATIIVVIQNEKAIWLQPTLESSLPCKVLTKCLET